MIREQDLLIKLENDRYYILASSSYADDRTRVLNSGNTFAIFDRWGDIKQLGTGVQGLYHEGTRYISEMQLSINGQRPALLSSNVKDENEVLSIDLTNPRMAGTDGETIDKGVLHISRTKFLVEGVCHERISFHNYDVRELVFDCKFSFAGDFRDIFEVRGIVRQQRGTLNDPELIGNDTLRISYTGLDDEERIAWIRFTTPMSWDGPSAYKTITLPPGQRMEISYSIQCTLRQSVQPLLNYEEALGQVFANIRRKKNLISDISTSNEQFTHWIDRSKKDLISLLAETEHGYYPYAGVPWYNTIFGRDGIITALETLWVAPEIAKGVLLYLAANQASTSDPFRDAEPGKILHEARGGEMAALDEIPFRKYYGTIDATPLFIALAGHYYRRTADSETIMKIWPNIERAIRWIEEYGDIDKDGFVEYQKRMESGLVNQGWKDSHDCIFYEDGRLATPPIALCEVQGYVYDAYRQASYLAKMFNRNAQATSWKQKALTLKRRFNEAFWDSSLGAYVLALDGDKKPCRIKTSNAGQCLFTGIADKVKAKRMATTLMQHDIFCGWGMRTVSENAPRYNPMSYHNGSVWPHDTALVAAGMARYGLVEPAMKLMGGLFSACLYIDLQRLPELFCGFSIRHGEAPTAYPVACMPQAWSVAAVYLLLQSCLQVTVDSPRRILSFDKPALPEYLERVRIRNLMVGSGVFDLELERRDWDIGIHLIAKPSDWQVIVRR
ncbi:MAG TPA: amylo-alpha-1,6-glucosidase [Cyclobacteriaceae bacterium]|jgi:glycogen debranching enzyme